MQYWSVLFSPQTYQEFRSAGSRVIGFRQRSTFNTPRVVPIEPGDIALFYVTGVQRWVGAATVIGKSADKSAIWTAGEFPLRYDVKPIVLLEVERGVPMAALEGRVEFYSSPQDRPGFHGFVRSSPRRFRRSTDGALVLRLVQAAERPR